VHHLGVRHHVIFAGEHLVADGAGDLLLDAAVRRVVVAAEVADVRVGAVADLAAADAPRLDVAVLADRLVLQDDAVAVAVARLLVPVGHRGRGARQLQPLRQGVQVVLRAGAVRMRVRVLQVHELGFVVDGRSVGELPRSRQLALVEHLLLGERQDGRGLAVGEGLELAVEGRVAYKLGVFFVFRVHSSWQ